MRGIDVQALAIGVAYEEFHAVAGGANARLKLLAHATLKTSKTTIRKKTQRERRCMTTTLKGNALASDRQALRDTSTFTS